MIYIKDIVIDCNNLEETTRFYKELLDLVETFNDGEFITLETKKKVGVRLIFQKVENYLPPQNMEKQMLHLDLAVDNLEKYVELAINLGAKIYKEQFFDSIKIMIDPAGHTFCLCQQ